MPQWISAFNFQSRFSSMWWCYCFSANLKRWLWRVWFCGRTYHDMVRTSHFWNCRSANEECEQLAVLRLCPQGRGGAQQRNRRPLEIMEFLLLVWSLWWSKVFQDQVVIRDVSGSPWTLPEMVWGTLAWSRWRNCRVTGTLAGLTHTPTCS